jgi:hypothetical protein
MMIRAPPATAEDAAANPANHMKVHTSVRDADQQRFAAVGVLNAASALDDIGSVDEAERVRLWRARSKPSLSAQQQMQVLGVGVRESCRAVCGQTLWNLDVERSLPCPSTGK